MTTLLEIGTRGAAPGEWAGGWAGPWWILVPFVLVVLAATVIWLVARRNTERAEPPGGGAAGILAARYARGEIDTEEYRRRLDEIRGLQ